ncbi:ser thr kinase [Stylonychia lemnae]|uniref:Casein kinase I n=1 Tax=Stylonychia lemnae TaxID=5949 RepID=A0A078B2Q1_STYLE|nr:ser thr kinase [Stylonychia lemnae]|eukprot:CDW88754.1 ser thr kinase [Stylonychia lemnae]
MLKVGFPMVHACGVEGDYNYIVIDLLGPSLEDFFNILETYHKRSFMHRDVKPDNFLMGLKNRGGPDVVHIIDFGLSKRYIDPRTKKHIEYRKDKYLTGTARYASIHSHLGEEMSRRDDMESLAYMMIYLYKGELPWQNLKDYFSDQCQKIKEVKLATSTKSLCKNCPRDMIKFVDLCKNLTFDQEPPYQQLINILNGLADKEGIDLTDKQFDWDENKFQTFNEDPERIRIMNIQNSNVIQAYSAMKQALEDQDLNLRNERIKEINLERIRNQGQYQLVIQRILYQYRDPEKIKRVGSEENVRKYKPKACSKSPRKIKKKNPKFVSVQDSDINLQIKSITNQLTYQLLDTTQYLLGCDSKGSKSKKRKDPQILQTSLKIENLKNLNFQDYENNYKIVVSQLNDEEEQASSQKEEIYECEINFADDNISDYQIQLVHQTSAKDSSVLIMNKGQATLQIS